MPTVSANGMSLYYERSGDPDGEPLLLIAGHSCTSSFWDENLCRQFGEAGFSVIKFDNRDCGRSTILHSEGAPNRFRLFVNHMLGRPIEAPYTFEDMADDAVALLRALDISEAHICGMSMGSSIAQYVAIRHPEAVRSLSIVYGTTARRGLAAPSLKVMRYFLTPPPAELEEFKVHFAKSFGMIAGDGFEFDHQWHLALAERIFDAGIQFDGMIRQGAAAAASQSTSEKLRNVERPILVVHGTDDKMQPIDGAIDIAANAPTAMMKVIEGWGHNLPDGSAPWPEIVQTIRANADRVNG